MTSPADIIDIERAFEERWSASWYARYRLARGNFEGVWTGPIVPIEIVDMWKRRDWHDLVNGTGGVPAENTYHNIIERLKIMDEVERSITGCLCGPVPLKAMPMYDRADGVYWRATRAHNVLHRDVREFTSPAALAVEDHTFSGLVVVPHCTLAATDADVDALKNEPPVTIVPVPEEN